MGAARQAKGDIDYYFPMIKSFFNTEDKFINTTNTAVSLGTTPVQYLLNGCVQGTTQSTREGISTRAVSLELLITIAIDNLSTEPVYVRWVLVRDDQANSSTFTSTTYWDSNNYYTFTNPGFIERFHTYRDEIITVSPNGPEGLVCRMVVPLSFHTKYNNTSNAGTSADIGKSTLVWMAVSNDNVNTPTLDFNARFWFNDN